ncbi:hypothetical protein ANANG_G00240600 [Anguilla anguilla]|uniref:Uncharacterized protein n=1 Tax=Anguilla anguilla TaxID=7936 RepID=A0A9D3LV19_ANGAN|nr:hypothetical protein ANANG_G00240600 [Anguilla anguilla]
MLAEMMQSKCPQIWSQDCQSRAEKLMLLDRLRQQEASLMEYVLQSSAPLLEDPRFLPRVSACQAAASGLQAELLELDQELERQRPLLARLRGRRSLSLPSTGRCRTCPASPRSTASPCPATCSPSGRPWLCGRRRI